MFVMCAHVGGTCVHVHEYDTRRKDDLHVQKCNTSICRKGVINMGIKLYNNLPLELRKVKGERNSNIN
jgi:hypothetical protein